MSDTRIENLLHENRVFPPPEGFAARANATADLYTEADRDHVAFWMDQALSRLDWFTEPTVALTFNTFAAPAGRKCTRT